MSVPAELQLIFEAFDRNARVTRALLATLSMEDLDHSDGVGGYSVGQHLADIVDFRPGWLSRVSPAHAETVPDVTGDTPNWLTIGSIAELQAAFDAGDEAIKEAVLDAVREAASRRSRGCWPRVPGAGSTPRSPPPSASSATCRASGTTSAATPCGTRSRKLLRSRSHWTSTTSGLT